MRKGLEYTAALDVKLRTQNNLWEMVIFKPKRSVIRFDLRQFKGHAVV